MASAATSTAGIAGSSTVGGSVWGGVEGAFAPPRAASEAAARPGAPLLACHALLVCMHVLFRLLLHALTLADRAAVKAHLATLFFPVAVDDETTHTSVPPPPGSCTCTPPLERPTFGRVSVFYEHVCTRYRQLCHAAKHSLQYVRLGSSEVCLAEHIRLFNLVALLVIDMLVGLVCCFFFMKYSRVITIWPSLWLEQLNHAVLETNIRWLMGWPAGLKLNGNLDMFLGNLFLFYIHNIAACLSALSVYRPLVMQTIGLLGCLGFSSQLALLVDIFRLSLIHISWSFAVSAKIYALTLNGMAALWRLFTGKKRNILRLRIDSCDFNREQLLLGTILFTVLFFLLPTVAVYYLFFSMIKLMLHVLQVAALVVLEILHFFPLYGICLYLVDPSLLPGGVFFEVIERVDKRKAKARQRPRSLSLLARDWLKGGTASDGDVAEPISADSSGDSQAPAVHQPGRRTDTQSAPNHPAAGNNTASSQGGSPSPLRTGPYKLRHALSFPALASLKTLTHTRSPSHSQCQSRVVLFTVLSHADATIYLRLQNFHMPFSVFFRPFVEKLAAWANVSFTVKNLLAVLHGQA